MPLPPRMRAVLPPGGRDGVPDRIPPGRNTAALAAGVLVLTLLLMLLMIERIPAARAAESADVVSIAGWELGNFRSSNGEIVYCLEPGGRMPAGAQREPALVSELPAFWTTSFDQTGWSGAVSSAAAGGDTIRRMNYLLSVHGATRDPRAAAAVQLAVWLVRPDPGTDAWMKHHIIWAETHGAADIVQRARALASEARTNAVPVRIELPGALELRADDGFRSGELSYPSGTTSVTIAGARFPDGSTTRTIVDGAAGTVAWRAELHADGWERKRTVTAEGAWKVSKAQWPDSLRLHPPTVDAQQRLGAGIGPGQARREGRFEPTSLEHDERFEPVLTTRVPQVDLIRERDRFADTVTLAIEEQGRPWPWRMKGGEVEHAPVRAEGTVYGPFAQAPVEGERVPAGAPVAARATLLASRGPGEYSVSADSAPDEAGYYVWVWRIRGDRQPQDVRSAGLIDPEYRFQDRFGVSEEQHRVATALRWTTRISADGLRWDHRGFSDRVTVELQHGAWLRDENGDRIPARIRLTAYGSEQRPERRAEPPADAPELAASFVEVNAPGVVESEPMELPHGTRGWVTVQACLRQEDQDPRAAGAFEDWCDDYGIPDETAEIEVPSIRTEAQEQALVGGGIRDHAVVEGVVPRGTEIDFTFYLQPKAGEPKFDERWQPKRDAMGEVMRWSASELESLSPEAYCLAQPVGRTAAVPIGAAGRFASPELRARSAGTGYWVETATVPGNGPEAPRVELHRGECGLETERTIIQAAPEDPPATARPDALPRTGGLPGGAIIGIGAALILCAAILAIRVGTRRRSAAPRSTPDGARNGIGIAMRARGSRRT